ncbi:MAG TPA: hypothetical protein VHC41_04530, partial [Mycobacteriales bacterium]|nr:hypothetical protein [Mycobacteriales bacterium]
CVPRAVRYLHAMADGAAQLSFFSAAGSSPVVEDLAGVLCGPGQVVRRGNTARISVVLVDGWRIAALRDELALRGVDGEVHTAGPADGWSGPAGAAHSVRTPFASALAPLGAGWADTGSGKRVPSPMQLTGGTLRLWCIVSGRPWASGFMLGLGERDEPCWEPLGAALREAGLLATLVGPRGDGPAYRILRGRRLARLAELVGDPPAGAPEDAWPG